MVVLFLYSGDSYTGKIVSLYWNAPLPCWYMFKLKLRHVEFNFDISIF